jgi:hypothetical protein
MAVIPLTAQNLAAGGLTTAYTGSLSTSNTYTFVCDGQTFLHFKKSGAGSCTVTIITPGTVGGLAIADQTVTVPASTGDVMVGRLSSDLFADPATGLATFSCSEITGLSVGVFHP